MGINTSENHSSMSSYTDFKQKIPMVKQKLWNYFDSKLNIMKFEDRTPVKVINNSSSLPSLVPLMSRDNKPRHILVIVNPIAGQKRSLQYYHINLKPVLDHFDISHDLVVTEDQYTVSNTIKNLDADKMNYTDFVMISGDGIFSQVVNACAEHPQKEQLLKVPMGFMPGGSANALSSALGWGSPEIAAIRIARGDVVKGDVIEITMDNGKQMYTTGLAAGYASVSIENNNRKLFGKHRYTVSSIWRYLKPVPLPYYNFTLMYKPISYWPKNYEHTDDGWIIHPWKSHFFFSLLSHEIRNTLSNKCIAPVTRLNDGKMIVHMMEKCNKLEAPFYLFKFLFGSHLYVKKVLTFDASEVRVINEKPEDFTIDGELYHTKEYHAKLLPGFINFIGDLYEYTDNDKKLKADLKIY